MARLTIEEAHGAVGSSGESTIVGNSHKIFDKGLHVVLVHLTFDIGVVFLRQTNIFLVKK